MQMAVRLIRSLLYGLLTLTGLVLNPVIHLLFGLANKRGRRVSPVSNKILLQSASSLAKQIRARELTAEEVMMAFVERAKDVNPIVNAIVAERYDAALMEAKKIDEILDSGDVPNNMSEKKAPFLGVPLSVKEAFATVGMPNTSGLASRVGMLAEEDADVVRLLKEAGMIPFAITNVSELCMWYESANNLYGRTRNPYDTSRIVGGSSGGEGCIIAAGASVVGIGSDIGGSIRMPAFFNGIFGHKPSRGLVSNNGQFPNATGAQQDMLATGPMCRYAQDLRPLLTVMAGPKAASLKQPVDVRSVRVMTMEDDGGSLLCSFVDPQIKIAQRQACQYLERQHGMTVQKVSLRRFKYSVDMWSAKMSCPDSVSFSQYMAGEGAPPVNGYAEFLRWLVGGSPHTLPAILLSMAERLEPLLEANNVKFREMLQQLQGELGELLGEDGVLLYPTHPRIAPYHNEPLAYPLNFAYTGIFNALGLPVTQVPLGLSLEGLPLGVQVVGGLGQDHLTLAVAQELERGLGGWVNPGTAAAAGV